MNPRAHVNHHPRVELELAARTDLGNQRDVNEDSFLVADLTARSRDLGADTRVVGPRGIVLAICDGMGGAAAGEIASELAVETLYTSLVATSVTRTAMSKEDFVDALESAARRAALRIHEDAKADPSREGMGTTLTAAALVGRHVVLAQIGDSRAYLLRDGQLNQITRDQSLVAKLLERGSLSVEDIGHFAHPNEILQSLGSAETVDVEITYAELAEGDRLLLCSDGLHKIAEDGELRSILALGQDPESTCEELIERAKELGSDDNITVIVAFFDGGTLRTDVGPVVVTARGGTDLRKTPDPRRLGARLSNMIGAGVTDVPPGPEGDSAPSAEISRLPAPPTLPSEPFVTEAGIPQRMQESRRPVQAHGRASGLGSSAKLWIVAALLLGLALALGSAIFVAFEVPPREAAASRREAPSPLSRREAPTGWTQVEPAITSNVLVAPSAAPTIRPTAARSPTNSPAPKSGGPMASTRRSELAPIRDEAP